ncbi:DUF4197 domain-containing protein [Parvularcula maris]|uniref:DUF4197 domain-containing protein n=1 Tax=Parvularcula maris TaxID=2965077 RepID=A0A9X2L7B7_9PROT|nr:DUF4197 domain-containing protein [Parvularcula maris]MCQ8184418.1 DUF4197 domain-containing protein [Parvularcula maris]
MPSSRRSVLFLLAGGGVAACTPGDLGSVVEGVLGSQGGTAPGGLSQAEAAEGIRAALSQGVGQAIAQVGKVNGYFADREVRIPLPPRLASLQSDLSRFGLSGSLDELERQLNRGAEEAAPQARSIFSDAIRRLTIADALNIVRGSDTAATEYFQRETTEPLTRLFSPIMEQALQRTGAIRTFDQMAARLSNVPLAPQLGEDAKRDLIGHGVGRGLDGLFYYVAREEQAIRSNPAKRTSEILRRVFG